MNELRLRTVLEPAVPAGAILLTDEQVEQLGAKEYAVWIAEAKREETRQRRVTQALQMLRDGKTRS